MDDAEINRQARALADQYGTPPDEPIVALLGPEGDVVGFVLKRPATPEEIAVNEEAERQLNEIQQPPEGFDPAPELDAIPPSGAPVS